MKKKGDKPHYKPGTDKKYKKYEEDWKPEIEHSKLGDAVKKKAEKKRKKAEDSLPPHLKLDVMKKAFAHTNEEVSYEKLKKKIGSKKMHNKPVIEENKFVKAMVDAVRKKKEEKKPEKAMDAGARLRRKKQRQEYAAKISGSEDNVPDDIRDHKNWDNFKKHI
jgi:hypothetical protein